MIDIIFRTVSSLLVAAIVLVMAPIADFVYNRESISDTLGTYLHTSELLQYLPYALVAGIIWFLVVKVVKKFLLVVIFVMLLIALALYFGLANEIIT